ncbi:hypothetical protein L6452_38565 [Arctium lappa]|uniref:Uncharacterized protein n=1 Tax=Arctium lappa TaxID=4217 RepID=A0ACB8XQG0_ARCLA|nr:hypothetical protein L6452_38565 [Arctium lappa]
MFIISFSHHLSKLDSRLFADTLDETISAGDNNFVIYEAKLCCLKNVNTLCKGTTSIEVQLFSKHDYDGAAADIFCLGSLVCQLCIKRDLSFNMLSGDILFSILKLKQLEILSLIQRCAEQYLSGTIPFDIDNCTGFQVL